MFYAIKVWTSIDISQFSIVMKVQHLMGVWSYIRSFFSLCNSLASFFLTGQQQNKNSLPNSVLLIWPWRAWTFCCGWALLQNNLLPQWPFIHFRLVTFIAIYKVLKGSTREKWNAVSEKYILSFIVEAVLVPYIDRFDKLLFKCLLTR